MTRGRRQIEDYMVILYPGVAIQSYQIMGGDSLTDENAASQKFKSKGFGGIVTMKQVNESTSQEYISGRMPTYYRTWNGYWGNGWGDLRWTVHYNPGTPGQVNGYSFITNKLIWSANTSTTDPGGRSIV
jgi:hypothetical protein